LPHATDRLFFFFMRAAVGDIRIYQFGPIGNEDPGNEALGGELPASSH